MANIKNVKTRTYPIVSSTTITEGDFVKLTTGSVEPETSSFSTNVVGRAIGSVTDNSTTTGLTDYIGVTVEGRVKATGLVEGSAGTYKTNIAIGTVVSLYLKAGVQYLVANNTAPVGRVQEGAVTASGGAADSSGEIIIDLDLTMERIDTDELVGEAITVAKMADLAQGSLLSGQASDRPAALAAETDGYLLLGDGTDVNSVVMSGDVSIINDGTTTVGSIDLETATITGIADTEIMIGTGAAAAGFFVMSGDATLANTGALTLAEDLTIIKTDEGAVGYVLTLEHVSTTPAALDAVAVFVGQGRNDAAGTVIYGQLGIGIVDPANGAEVGGLSASFQNASGSLPITAQFVINGGSGSIAVTREDDGAEGAAISLTQVSASAAINDEVGFVKFIGNNDDTPVDLVEYVQIAGVITDPTDAAEFGQGRFKAQNGTGSMGVAGGWANDGSFGQLLAGDGAGQGEFSSLGDFDVVLRTGNTTTGEIKIVDGAAGNIELTPDGAGTIVIPAAAGISSATANVKVGFDYTVATEIIAEGAGGAISVATYTTTIGADAGGDAFTLASGTIIGQRKKIIFVSTSGGTGVVTAAFRGTDNTLTFTAAGEFAELMWDGTDWLDVTLSSYGTFATPPALSQV